MIKKNKEIIEGVFGRKELIVEVHINTDSRSKKLYILLHGAYGKVYHNQPTKYEALATLLSPHHSVGFYQTSRNFMQMEKPHLSYDEYREQSFGGKKFTDEWEDVQRAISQIVFRYRAEKGDPEEIICVGFSMGGLWSCLLTKKYEKITKIYAFGSGVRFNLPSHYPLFESFPSVGYFRLALSKYKGELHVIHGSNDDLTSQSSALALFKLAKLSMHRSYHEWHGVDHQFSYLNNVACENHLIKKIIKVISRE